MTAVVLDELKHVLFLSEPKAHFSEVLLEVSLFGFQGPLVAHSERKKIDIARLSAANSAKKFFTPQREKVFRSCNINLVPYSPEGVIKSIRFCAMKQAQVGLKPNTGPGCNLGGMGRFGNVKNEAAADATAMAALPRRVRSSSPGRAMSGR